MFSTSTNRYDFSFSKLSFLLGGSGGKNNLDIKFDSLILEGRCVNAGVDVGVGSG